MLILFTPVALPGPNSALEIRQEARLAAEHFPLDGRLCLRTLYSDGLHGNGGRGPRESGVLERPQVLGSGDLYLQLSGICFLISEMGGDSADFTE